MVGLGQNNVHECVSVQKWKVGMSVDELYAVGLKLCSIISRQYGASILDSVCLLSVCPHQ